MQDDLALYFGPNGGRLRALMAASRGRFCWPGFLFPQAWFLYRKMYGWAALTTATPTLGLYAHAPVWTLWAASLVGALGLPLYFRAAAQAAAAIRAQGLDEDEARARLARAGGVSRLGAALGALYIFAMFIAQMKLAAS